MRISRHSHEESEHEASEVRVVGIGELHDHLEHALKDWKHDLADHRKKLRGARARYDRAIKSVEGKRADANKSSKLAGDRLGPVTLYEDALDINHTRYPLTPDVNATVDTAGNLSRTRRYTATRFVLLGPAAFFVPKARKHDDRELFLLIEAEGWNELVKLEPDKQAGARSLAQDINLAARNVDAARAARAERVAAVDVELERAVADRSEIDAAEDELHQAYEKGLARVGEARAALAAHLRSLSAPEGRVVKKATTLLDEAAVAMAQPPEELSFPTTEAGAEIAEAGAEASTELAQDGPLAVAGDKSPPVEPNDTFAPGADAVTRIKQLGELRDAGLITEEQFTTKRDDLLGRI